MVWLSRTIMIFIILNSDNDRICSFFIFIQWFLTGYVAYKGFRRIGGYETSEK